MLFAPQSDVVVPQLARTTPWRVCSFFAGHATSKLAKSCFAAVLSERADTGVSLLMLGSTFQVVCEVESAIRPVFTSLHRQVEALASIASSFLIPDLIPDNHLGPATVSSIASAHEVAGMGAHPIACINSRDRNLLGFQRDLLTAAAYGVSDLLCVFGDRSVSEAGTHDLNVASMLVEAQAMNASARSEVVPFVLGVTTRLKPIPAWKLNADMLFVQAGFDLGQLFSWRASVEFSGPVYAGVLVVASVQMAKAMMAATDEIQIPDALIARLEDDPMAGVGEAVAQVANIEASGVFSGVHLISVGRYREVATRLASSSATEIDRLQGDSELCR